MLAAGRRHDGLVVDARVGHQHAECLKRRDGAALERQHPILVLEVGRPLEVGTAGVGDRRYSHAPFGRRQRGQRLQPGDARLAKALGVGHHVRLGHRHHVGGAEEAADLQLVLERKPSGAAGLAGQHAALFIVQPHRRHPACFAVGIESSSRHADRLSERLGDLTGPFAHEIV